MLLNKLIKIEESLLRFEAENKYKISFDEYIKLNKLLKEIGEITTNYFILMKEYDAKLQNDNFDEIKRKEALIDYNNKLLASNIYINEDKINLFIKNNNIK